MISKLSFFRERKGNIFDPCRNLALEKYLTFHSGKEECILYLWQNACTVVIGKNQNAGKECNVEVLEADGGHLVRRLSGGGAVFHDLGNLNFTFCVRKENYDVSKQLDVILHAVQGLGIPAVKTGRNDLAVSGRKFSGNAFYQSKDFCFHHGTIMMDVDVEKMNRYLNVPPEKLRQKGVDSVRSRVVNLRNYCPELTADELADSLERSFSQVYGLPVGTFSRQIPEEEIRKDTAFFASPQWVFGKKIPVSHRISGRFLWGGIEILLQVGGGQVTDCICHSDAMDQEYIDLLALRMKGKPFDLSVLAESVPGDDAFTDQMGCDPDALRNQMKEDICSMLKKAF